MYMHVHGHIGAHAAVRTLRSKDNLLGQLCFRHLVSGQLCFRHLVSGQLCFHHLVSRSGLSRCCHSYLREAVSTCTLLGLSTSCHGGGRNSQGPPLAEVFCTGNGCWQGRDISSVVQPPQGAQVPSINPSPMLLEELDSLGLQEITRT